MSRYIDADELLTAIHDKLSDNKVTHRIRAVNRLIKGMPTADVVEVVRCKDCKYWIAPYKTMPDVHQCNRGWGLQGICAEDDFCSYGERCEE